MVQSNLRVTSPNSQIHRSEKPFLTSTGSTSFGFFEDGPEPGATLATSQFHEAPSDYSERRILQITDWEAAELEKEKEQLAEEAER